MVFSTSSFEITPLKGEVLFPYKFCKRIDDVIPEDVVTTYCLTPLLYNSLISLRTPVLGLI